MMKKAGWLASTLETPRSMSKWVPKLVMFSAALATLDHAVHRDHIQKIDAFGAELQRVLEVKVFAVGRSRRRIIA